MRRLALSLCVLVLICLAAFTVLARLSPWPGVYVLRAMFEYDAAIKGADLAALPQEDPTEVLDLAYGPDQRERLDLFLPPGPPPPEGWPVLLWVHGGAFFAGEKEDVAPYLRLIAPQGYAAIAMDYTRAPTARHPGPSAQVLEALLWIRAVARDRPLDPDRIVLAGDSAGSHIALQTAIALHDPAYARLLGLRPLVDAAAIRGLALFCGIYDLPDRPENWAMRFILRTAAWSYLGAPDIAEAPFATGFPLVSRLPPGLPPLFISAGNADPLLPQSQALARAAEAQGIEVTTLFFAPDHQPPLGHEYQFTRSEAADTARRDLLAFLAKTTLAAD